MVGDEVTVLHGAMEVSVEVLAEAAAVEAVSTVVLTSRAALSQTLQRVCSESRQYSTYPMLLASVPDSGGRSCRPEIHAAPD